MSPSRGPRPFKAAVRHLWGLSICVMVVWQAPDTEGSAGPVKLSPPTWECNWVYPPSWGLCHEISSSVDTRTKEQDLRLSSLPKG